MTRLAAGSVIAAVALGRLLKLKDPDIWWHVRTGRWIWEESRIPEIDPFSHSAGGPWTYVESVADLFFYGLHRLGGPAALILGQIALVAVLGTLTYRLVLREIGKREPAGSSRFSRDVALVLGMALWGMASHFRLGPKTETFTFLAFAVLLLLLAEVGDRRRPILLLWTIPLFVLWANVHRGGALGVGILLLVALRWALDPSRRRVALFCAGAGVAAAAALLVNPSGVGYLQSAVDLLTRGSFASAFPEWMPMRASFFYRDDLPYALLLLAWGLGLIRNRRVDAFDLVGLVTVLLAFNSLRFAPVAAIAIAPVAAVGLAGLVSPLERLRPIASRSRLLLAGCTAVALSAVAVQYLSRNPVGMRGLGIVDWRVPLHAARFLEQNPPPGEMWNDFDFGGYFLFALSPRQKVFIDGRNDTVYSDYFFRETIRARDDRITFQRQVERYGIGYAIVACDRLYCDTFPWLQDSNDWRLVYLDDLAAIYVRETPASEDYIARHAYRELRLNDCARRAARLATDPARDEFERELERYARQSPRSMRAAFLLTSVHRLRGDTVAFERERQRFANLAAPRGFDFRAGGASKK